MVGWRHCCNGHEFEQAPEDGEGQGSLACCSPWGFRVRHDLQLNNNNITSQKPSKIKSITVSTFSTSIYHEVMGLDAMILAFFFVRSSLSFFYFFKLYLI